MPSAYSLYGLNIILIVSAYVYMNMNCFGQVFCSFQLVTDGTVAADSFSCMVSDGFGWFRMVLGGFGWFRVVCCFSSYGHFNSN